MSSLNVLGSTDPVVTGERKETSDRNAKVIEVEGLYSMIENDDPRAYCPSGYVVESSTVASTGDGMGKMTIRCVCYNEGASFSAERTTFRVDMLEVHYDLEDHPSIEEDRDIIVMWLATQESKRIVEGKFYYLDDDGKMAEIKQSDYPFAIKFITAYRAGIKSFFRYYPVIERIGIFKNPPGMSRNYNSFTGGSPTFSQGIGTYDDPPLSLGGYPNGHWFKSKDSWVNNADKTWTRTEQWTYTPESRNGMNGWVYTDL